MNHHSLSLLFALVSATACVGGDAASPPTGAATAGASGSSTAGAAGTAGTGGATAGTAGGTAGGAGGAVAGSAGQAGGGGSGESGAGGTAGGGNVITGPGRVRVAAANLTSGTKQSWDPGEGVRILAGLDLDVVLAQELNIGAGSDAELQAMAKTVLGPTGSAAREPSVGLPNGILSRYPIVAQGSWDDPETTNRETAWARIDIPGDRDLVAVSVHLLTSNATKRDLEAKSIAAQIGQLPGNPFVVLGGDFNTSTRDEPCIQTLAKVLSVLGPYPADAMGNDGTNATRSKPYDWVLPSEALRGIEVPVTIGGVAFASGLVFDSRVFSPLSAVAPVEMGDSGANGMQHMAVVREFYVP